MKKLVFMFVAVAAISFASCGNQTKPAAPVEDSIPEVMEDSVLNDSTDSTSTATPDSTVNAQ
jgi:hypothetical protein